MEATRATGAASLIVGTLFFGVLENWRRACELCINHTADAQAKSGVRYCFAEQGKQVGYMGIDAGAAGPYHHYTFELFALDTKL